MKRFIYIFTAALALTLAAAPAARAQEKATSQLPYKYEFRLGICGYPTLDYENFTPYYDYIYYNDTPIKDLFSDYDGPTYMTGNIMASLDIHYRKRITLSLGLATNGVWKNQYDVFTDQKTRRVSGVVMTALSQIKFNWVAREVVRVYSSVGLGITAGGFDDISDAYLAGQAVLLGVSVGRRFVGFAECGTGSMYMGGMVGVGYRF